MHKLKTEAGVVTGCCWESCCATRRSWSAEQWPKCAEKESWALDCLLRPMQSFNPAWIIIIIIIIIELTYLEMSWSFALMLKMCLCSFLAV